MSEPTSRAVPPEEYVEGLARGLAVIEAFDEEHPEMTLTEVSKRTGLSPAAVRRSLRTLAVLGYVRQAGKRFLLDAKVLSLGSSYMRASGADGVLKPELRQVVSKFGGSSSVCVLSGTNILYVSSYSEERDMRPVAQTGGVYPAFATSTGRVLLGSLPDAALDGYFGNAKLVKMTTATETDEARLRQILIAAAQDGYATTVDELAYGVTSIAVPIVVRGWVVAALNSSGYTGHTSRDEMIGLRLTQLQTCARQLAGLIAQHPALINSLMPSF